MPANNRDRTALWDMARAIRRIQEFTVQMSEADYLQSVLVQSAVERQLEILGEAARRVSEDYQQAHPSVDWRNIIGLRNVLAHRYDQISQERIFRTVQDVLSSLLAQVDTLISEDF